MGVACTAKILNRTHMHANTHSIWPTLPSSVLYVFAVFPANMALYSSFFCSSLLSSGTLQCFFGEEAFIARSTSSPAGEGMHRDAGAFFLSLHWAEYLCSILQFLSAHSNAPSQLRGVLLWQYSWGTDTSKVPHQALNGLLLKRMTNQCCRLIFDAAKIALQEAVFWLCTQIKWDVCFSPSQPFFSHLLSPWHVAQGDMSLYFGNHH